MLAIVTRNSHLIFATPLQFPGLVWPESISRHQHERPYYLLVQKSTRGTLSHLASQLGPFNKNRANCDDTAVLNAVRRSRAVIEFDLNGSVLTANDNFLRAFGYSLQEVVGKHHSMFLCPTDRDTPEYQDFWEGINRGEFYAGEYRCLGRAGNDVWIQTTYNPIFDEDHAPYKMVAFASDITKRKHASLDFENQMEAIGASQAIVEFDMNGTVLRANPNALAVLGYSLSEVQGRHHSLFVEESYRTSEAYRELWEKLNRGTFTSDEYRRIRKDGSTIWIQASYNPVRDDRGAPYKVVKFFTDASAQVNLRKQASNLELRTSMLENLLQSIASVLIVVSCEGLITHWNSTALHCFGLSWPEVEGKHLENCGIKWLCDSSVVENLLSGTVTDRRADLPFERMQEKRWLEVSVREVNNLGVDGESGFLITASDITNRLALEKQLRQVHKLEAIGQLAAGIAHEINTPAQYVADNLNFVEQSWNELYGLIQAGRELRKGAGGVVTTSQACAQYDRIYESVDLEYALAEMPKALAQALAGMQRISHIVNGMKELSHPGSEAKTSLCLNRALETAITVSRSEWKYCAAVNSTLDASLPQVLCHGSDIEQVFLNLIVNAAHTICEKMVLERDLIGQIDVTSLYGSEWVEIRITDNGMGIPEAIQGRVFEPFFTTKEVGKGTGQGLAHAYEVIVKRHGGYFSFETFEGQGTTFSIRLPRFPCEETEPNRRERC